MRKILFIYPRLGYMDAQRSKPAPPLGILAAVSFLKDTYEIIILDQRLFASDDSFYAKLYNVLQNQPLYAGLSVYSGGMIKFALEISRYIKEQSSVPVVWGGIHPSLLPEQTLENQYIDYVIQGEGELTLPEFSDRLVQYGQNMPPVRGVWIKKQGKIAYGGDRDLIDLQAAPVIPYDLVDFNNYVQYYNGHKYAYYQASRGCPRHCRYCYNHVFNKGKFRAKSADKIISEIKTLAERYASFTGIFFVDDNIFAMGKDYVMNLGKGLGELGLRWAVQGSDIIALKDYTESDFKRLETCGLTRLTIGVESASKKMRTLIGKQGSPADIEQIMARLSGTKILIWCSYIISLPGETLDDLRASIKLIFRLQHINPNVRNSPFYMYIPFSGTPLYEQYKDIFPGPESLEEWGQVGWEREHTNSFADYLKDTHFFQSLFLTSLLDDDKVSDFSKNKLLVFLAKCYRPVARWRLKNLFFKFNIELSMFKKFFPDIF